MGRGEGDVLRIGDQPFAGLALDCGRIEQSERDRVDACRSVELRARHCVIAASAWRAAIVSQANRHVEKRVADLGIADMQVLIRQKAEKLILDDGAAGGSSEDVTVQLRNLIVRRNISRPD